MSDFTFNCSLGREVELYNRVKVSDPTNAALVLRVLAASGLETDSVLKDKDSFTDLVSGNTNWVTNAGYAPIVITDAGLAAYTVDDSLDRVVLQLVPQTFATVSSGDTWSKLVIGFDPDSTGGTDADIIPITAHDLRINGVAVIPNGDDIIIAFENGFVICD